MRTYDWNGNTDLPMSCPDKSDWEVAGLVRMLMRDQLNHEHVCCMARDRIMALSKEKAMLMDTIGQLLARIDDMKPDDSGLSMHACGQTPDWYVEAAYQSCYGQSARND